MLSPKTYCNPNNFLFRENNSDITIEAHRFLNGEGDNSGCPHGRFRASVRYDKNTVRGKAFDWVSQSLRNRQRKEIETANRSERKYRGANENSNLEQANCPNRGKTRLAKSRLVLVLNRIGLEIGASFLYQSWKPKQSRMTFDTQLKTVLLPCISVGVIEVMKKRREIVFELLSRVNIGGVQHECVCRRQC